MEPQTINTYTCIAGHITVTKTVDEGTTPMYINCPQYDCGKASRSAFYMVNQHRRVEHQQPTHEWYKPAHPERIPTKALREHCHKGGLLLRAVGEGDASVSLPEVPMGATRPEKFSETMRRLLKP